jgi:hypothetical protein
MLPVLPPVLLPSELPVPEPLRVLVLLRKGYFRSLLQ